MFITGERTMNIRLQSCFNSVVVEMTQRHDEPRQTGIGGAGKHEIKACRPRKEKSKLFADCLSEQGRLCIFANVGNERKAYPATESKIYEP